MLSCLVHSVPRVAESGSSCISTGSWTRIPRQSVASVFLSLLISPFLNHKGDRKLELNCGCVDSGWKVLTSVYLRVLDLNLKDWSSCWCVLNLCTVTQVRTLSIALMWVFRLYASVGRWIFILTSQVCISSLNRFDCSFALMDHYVNRTFSDNENSLYFHHPIG